MKLTKVNIKSKILAPVLCIVLALGVCSTSTQKAYAISSAETLSWKTNINASIGTDGAINVSEHKIINITKFIEKAKSYKIGTTEAPNTAPLLHPLVWGYRFLPEQSDITLSDAKIAILSDNDTIIGTWKAFDKATFLSKWKGEDSPITPTFTYSEDDKTMYLYTELMNSSQYTSQQCFEIMSAMTGTQDINAWTTTKAIINLDYTIERAAIIYKDVADFQWEYCPETWMMDSYDVSLSVSVPVGKGSIANPLGKVSSIETNTESTTERNIYAWGHGSSSGIVDLNPNGMVSLENKVVPGNSAAEIRIVFPASWLTNLDTRSDISKQNQSKLTTILKEESVWRDYRTDNVNKLVLPIIFSAICIIALIISLAITLRYRRKFSVDALSQSKLKEMHPCLLVRLKNWNHEFAHDLVVSILALNEKKRIKIKRMASGDFELHIKNPAWAKDAYSAKNINIIDKRTINFLFGQIACGNPLLRLSDIQNYARARSYEFMTNYLTWQSLLTDEVNGFANFKSAYDKARHIMFGISIALGIASIIIGIIFLEAITPIIGVLTAIVIAYIGNSSRNKIYFKDSKGNKINAINLNIGLSEYTETIDKFRIKAIKDIRQSVLDAQDIISKWNLVNIS